MPVERILEAEKRVECKAEHQMEFEVNSIHTVALKHGEEMECNFDAFL